MHDRLVMEYMPYRVCEDILKTLKSVSLLLRWGSGPWFVIEVVCKGTAMEFLLEEGG